MAMFSGSIPALVTPFRDGGVDEARLAALVNRQVAGGSAALVACGTTGEAPTLSINEHHRVIELTVASADGRLPVIAGCGSNDTMTALRHIERAAEVGAAAALVVAPYYNRPDADGLVAHFAYLADRSALPIILYNVPSRTVSDITPDVVDRLRAHERIVGIKDASGEMGRVVAHRLSLGTGYCQLAGNDDSALAHRAMGGSGCISVTANVAPALCASLQAAVDAGEWARARTIADRLHPLHAALFCGPSPAPTKYALNRLGALPDFDTRLPIGPAVEAARRMIDAALAAVGLELGS